MGPAALTYGRKGRLRSALGSIRRGGSKTRTDKETEDAATSQEPTRKKTVLRKRSLAESDTIDKLADELLDSSTPEPKVRECAPTSTPRTVTSRIDKRSSWTSPSPSRIVTRSPKRNSEVGLHRPLSSSQSASTNPPSLHPTSERGTSRAKVLQKSQSSRRPRKGDKEEPVKSTKSEPAEVNKKINAMLAATDSLKSEHTDLAKTRRTSRSGRTNVLGKMSEVWSRLHSRSPDCQSDQQSQRTYDLDHDHPPYAPADEDVDMTAGLERTVSNRSIRVNEGNNFNGHSRHKVQRMTGNMPDEGSNNDKPSCGSKNKIGRKMLSCRKPPAPIVVYPDARQRHSYVSSYGSNSMLEDHFTAESSFEDNLERGILRALPIGSSTPPRARVRRLSMSSSRYSTEQPPSSLTIAGDMNGKASSKKAEPCQSIQFSPKPSPPSKSSIYTHASLDPTTELGQHFDAFCRERAKKHPSPSKEELEVLEVDLLKLAKMKPTTFSIMEPDELSGPANPLRPRDPNMMVTKQQPSSRKRDSTGSIKDSHLSCSSPGSRLPRPVRSRPAQTPAVLLRIGHVDRADMTDELA